MDRVIIQRPRSGSWMKGLKTRGKVPRHQMDDVLEDGDFGPTKVRGRLQMSGSKLQAPRERKEFSDLLGPLDRFLESCVGRSWDKVYSEILRSADRRKKSGWHLLLHLEGLVETHSRIAEDGVTVYGSSMYRRVNQPITGFYVHPETDLLCFAPYPKWSQGTKKKTVGSLGLREFCLQTEAPGYFVRADSLNVLEFYDEKWFLLRFRNHDPNEMVWVNPSGNFRYKVLRKNSKLSMKYLVDKTQLGRRRVKRFRSLIEKTP
jgi:hypothetical protein